MDRKRRWNLLIEKNNDKSSGGSVSSSITLRFRNDILNKLKHEAAQKRISLNTLASQVFSSYAEYDALRGEHNLSSFLKTIESWLRVSGFQYSYYTSDNDRSHRFVIQHEMGRKWSLYFEELFSYVFKDLSSVKRPVFEITNNVIAFRVEQ